MSSTTVQVRMDTNVKEQLDALLKSMGLNMTTAVNLFAHAVINQRKIPFDITAPAPKSELVRDLEDVRAGRNMSKVYHSREELYKDLGI